MASWGCCLQLLEKLDSHALLELKVLHEGAWKLGKFMAFPQHLAMQATPDLHTLLKVTPKTHTQMQVMLINIQYKPTWILGIISAMPK